MITDLKSYPAMKDSGVEWLGEVPKHWEVERGKALFTKIERPVREADEVVTCFRDGTVTLRKNRRTQGFTESLKEIGYQGIRNGDLVIHAMDAFAGATGVADCDGKGTPVYAVCTPQPGVDAHYHAFLIREMARNQWILALSTGIRERSTDFRFGTYANERVPQPPLPEQTAIVRYLDYVGRRVSRLVRAKRKMIALLKEQKQAMIHQAVTRGLDPNVPMKDAGVDWLGQIPAHWEVLRCRYMFTEIDQRSSTGRETHLSMSQRLGIVPSDMVQSTLKSESYIGGKLCKEDDLVLNRLKAHLGVFSVAKQPGLISPDYSVFRMKRPLSMPYCEHVLRSPACRGELRTRAKGIVEGFWRLYTDDFYDIRLPVPPFEEQDAIMKHLVHISKEIDDTISRAEREIELLGEYRTRLTADVVTGKLDVRDAAADLPDEDSQEAVPDNLGEKS